MKTTYLEKKLSLANEKVKLLEKLIEEKSRNLFVEKEENIKLAYFAKASPFPIIRINGDGEILITNAAANEYFKEEKLRGKQWRNYVDMNLARLDISNGYIQHEYNVNGKFLLFCYKTVEDLDVTNIYGFDITERKRVEEELEKEQIRHLNSIKMATLGEMAGGIAHEINTPLGILSLSMDQLKVCYEKSNADMFSQIIEDMEATVMRMSRLISGFKTFCRDSGEGEFSFVSLKKMMDECIEICLMSLRDFEIDFIYPKDIEDITIECNPSEFSQVVINLVQNARDAIEMLPNPWIKLEVNCTDSIEIVVTDSGLGIPEEVIDKIFVPFYTTKDIGKGTGLGLAIIKGIVDRHNGEIMLDKTAINTSFKIQIPLIQSVGGFL